MKNKQNKKKLIALASLVVLLGVAAFAAFSSDDLQGKRRNKRKRVAKPPAITQQVATQPSSSITLPIAPPAPAPACGDGNVDSAEACDDGNTINGDGCSSTCLEEAVEKNIWFNRLGGSQGSGAVHRNSGRIFVSTICPISQNWEPIGQWGISIDSDNTLENVGLRTSHQYNVGSGTYMPYSSADDYRLVVSTGKDDYTNTIVGSAEHTTDQDTFTITFPGDGVQLQDSYSANYQSEYYLTLEAKIKWDETSTYENIVIKSNLVNADTTFETLGSVHFATHPGTGERGGSWRRWVKQNDQEHPDLACTITIPSAEMNYTDNIAEVRIEACPETNNWIPVYQGTIKSTDADLQLETIPTKQLGIGAYQLNGIANVKAILSGTTDYLRTEIASFEYDQPPMSEFGIRTNAVLKNGETYYVTYLIKRKDDFYIAPQGHSVRAQIGMYSINNDFAPFGSFINPISNFADANASNVIADESNVAISGMAPRYNSNSGLKTGGEFTWVACTN